MPFCRFFLLLTFLLLSCAKLLAKDKPNSDAIAAEGLRLTKFNVKAECTPESRPGAVFTHVMAS